jgi:Lipopolysaccharide-assembly
MPSTRRPLRYPLLLLTASALLLPSCNWDGNFTILGYTTKPQYPDHIRTIYVPIFKNPTLWRGLEFDLTRAVIREIEAKTPYKVVSSPSCADSQLSGTIISLNKNVINRNQLNEIREAETTLAVEIVWKDLRTGEILSRPRPAATANMSIPPILPPTGTPGIPIGEGETRPPDYVPPGTPIGPPPPPPPVLVQSIASFIPELGESITTAQQKNVNRLAIQIVSMMESPW